MEIRKHVLRRMLEAMGLESARTRVRVVLTPGSATSVRSWLTNHLSLAAVRRKRAGGSAAAQTLTSAISPRKPWPPDCKLPMPIPAPSPPNTPAGRIEVSVVATRSPSTKRLITAVVSSRVPATWISRPRGNGAGDVAAAPRLSSSATRNVSWPVSRMPRNHGSRPPRLSPRKTM